MTPDREMASACDLPITAPMRSSALRLAAWASWPAESMPMEQETFRETEYTTVTTTTQQQVLSRSQ